MGRPRKDPGQGLPMRVYLKSGQFYYVHHNNKWEGLGRDLDVATKKAEAFNADSPTLGTMGYWLTKWHVYLDQKVATGGLAYRTVEDYKEATVYLTEYFGEMFPAEIEAVNIRDYLDIGVQLDRPVRANREKSALSSCMTWMIEYSLGKLKTNYCLSVKKNSETPRDRYITDDEYQEVYQRASAPVRAMMVLIYRTLQRPSDVLAWTHSNISEKKGQRILSFRQSKTKKPMSIILNDEIEKALKEVQDGREVSSPYLICTRDGEPYTEMGLASMFRRHVQDSSVRDYALYDHKAKGATDMHEDGVPLEIICELCGHSSVKVTEIYIKTHTRKPVEANGRVMEPSNTQSAPEGPKKKSRKKVLEKEV